MAYLEGQGDLISGLSSPFGFILIMEKKMETTIKVLGLGFRVGGT